MYDLWKALVAEFIGTFILTFVGAGAAAINVQNGGSVIANAFAFGLCYMFLIYTMSNFSGANYNPAISFSLALSGRLGWCRMLLYILVQLIGAIAAAALIAWVFGINWGAGSMVDDLSFSQPWKIVVITMFLSAFLIFTFLVVTKNPMLSMMSGLIIGLTLTALILFGGFFARANLNIAYALATEIFAGNLSVFWIIITGNIFGSLLAVLAYKLLVCYPWSCEEIANEGCDLGCGKPPFHNEHLECSPVFMEKGMREFERNKMELEAMGEPAGCFSPCNMPPPEPCPKPCGSGRLGRRRYASL